MKKKIEKPISIYWEDNVYPGFNKEDRELMIINYLDGVHLKTMALNGDGFGRLANHSLVMANYISRANAAIIDLRELLEKG